MRAAFLFGLLGLLAACGGPADRQAPLAPLPAPTLAQVAPTPLGPVASATVPISEAARQGSPISEAARQGSPIPAPSTSGKSRSAKQ